MTFRIATADDAAAIMFVRISAAHALTRRYGQGPWSTESTERGVLNGMRHSRIVLYYDGDTPIGTFRLTSHRPWAIDRAFFTPVVRPLYLTDMAVHPDMQRRGIGRASLAHAEAMTRAYPADAIWLDAYDAEAGASDFYATCGYRECGRTSFRDSKLVYFEKAIASFVRVAANVLPPIAPSP